MPSNTTAACPYLGLRGDPGTACTFPAVGNCCYHCRTPQTPVLAHQRERCLHMAHTGCPVFTAASDAAFPRALRLKRDGAQPVRQRVRVLLPSILILALILTGAWALERFVWLPPPVESPPAAAGAQTSPMPADPSATTAAEATPKPQAQPTSQPTARSTAAAAIPGPTHTAAASNAAASNTAATPTPQPHLLEVPVMAGDQALIIHWVQQGEGLELLAELYNTSPQAIQAVNVSLTSPLWADSAIVIPAGVTVLDPMLPAFDVYQVRVGLKDIDEAARYLNVDEEAMRHYNNCPSGCTLQAGEWLLIPRLK